jgi:2,3,4,5-tetrahydropyridine-2,6-dicarboxylate N-succinyltransferase
MTTHVLESLIDEAFERRSEITPNQVPRDLADALSEILDGLNQGRLRVAEKIDGSWVTHQWLKKAVLLYFRAHDNRVIDAGVTRYFDKVPLRFAGWSDAEFRQGGFRVVPPAVARTGAFIRRT